MMQTLFRICGRLFSLILFFLYLKKNSVVSKKTFFHFPAFDKYIFDIYTKDTQSSYNIYVFIYTCVYSDEGIEGISVNVNKFKYNT